MTLTWATTLIYLGAYFSGFFAAKAKGPIGYLFFWGIGAVVFFAMRKEIGV